MNFDKLRAANEARDNVWDPEHKIGLEFRAIEFGGEAGELLNVIKKILRERMGIRGSRVDDKDLADELADVVICADLIAMERYIDLGQAVKEKFNATSAKYQLPVTIED